MLCLVVLNLVVVVGVLWWWWVLHWWVFVVFVGEDRVGLWWVCGGLVVEIMANQW